MKALVLRSQLQRQELAIEWIFARRTTHRRRIAEVLSRDLRGMGPTTLNAMAIGVLLCPRVQEVTGRGVMFRGVHYPTGLFAQMVVQQHSIRAVLDAVLAGSVDLLRA